MQKYKGEIGLLIVAILYGSGFVASDIALSKFSPYQILFFRFLIAIIFLSLIFNKRLKQINKTTLTYGIILGFFLYFSFLLQIVGLFYTTPSKNAFLTALSVIIVPFIGVIFYKKKLNNNEIAGALLAILGIALISLKKDLSINIGDFLTILCAVGFAFHIFFTSEFLNRGADAILITIIQMATALILSFVVLFFVKNNIKNEVEILTPILSLIYLGLFCTSVAFLLQTFSQKFTTETKTAIILCTESVFGTLFSIMILHEQLNIKTILGCILIFISILISEVKYG